MTEASAETARSGTAKRIALYGSLLLAIIAILLLLLKTCAKVAPPAFDYFHAKAEELGKDPARVAKFVREDVRTLPYHGNVKGALGALWDGAGSPEEKAALAEAILEHCPGAAPVAVDGADEKAPVCNIKITHRFLTEDGPREQLISSGPIADLVGDVHSLVYQQDGSPTYFIRAKGLPKLTASRQGTMLGEEIVFTLTRPDDPEPLIVVRELWRKDNRLGPMAASPGDRHDFVVLPCRISKYVREKEELLLRNRGREKADEAKPYLALLDYCLRSDRMLADLERDLKVRAQFDLPRILVLSQFRLPVLPAPVYALDLRLNRTPFEGAPADAYLAAQIRSFVESGLEQHFLTEWSGSPSTSAFDVMSRLRDDYPNTFDRRLKLVRSALDVLARHAGLDGKVVFTARPPSGKAQTQSPSVTVTKRPDGRFHLKGGPIKADFARKLAETKNAPRPPYRQNALDAPFAERDGAALAVEMTLMAADVAPSVSPDYVLETQIEPGTEPLVAPGARFAFRWGEGESHTDQRIHVLACDDGLEYKWRVQTGVRPATGTRRVGPQALAEAATHNPWYRMGPSDQPDVSSFCISRKVFEALKAGQACELALQGRYGPDDDEKAPRPIEWKGQAAPAGTATRTVKINGREETIALVKARIGATEVAILDDPAYPVGMADRLVEVRTSIRGRVVDEKGVGIAGVLVKVGDGEGAETWPDGRFRLPPAGGAGYGRVKLVVKRGEEVLGEPEVDLTAPGRQVVEVQVARPRTELVWISPENLGDLDALPISDQAKRHARRCVEARQLVVIPNRMIDVGGTQTIGFYAYEPKSGSVVGVTEDGLHGSNTAPNDAWRRALESAAKDLWEARNELAEGGGFGAIHMMRGALVSWWLYSAYRVGGDEHEEVILRLLKEMDAWEEATNLLSGVGRMAGDKVREKVGELMGGSGIGVDGAGARLAFKVGYLGSTLFLAHALEGS